MPVGTQATVKGIAREQIASIGTQIMLSNTYHLYLQPGIEILKKAGGLSKFMNWSGPTFTDSGGFQAFSLGSGMGKIGKVAGAGKANELRDDLNAEERALLAKIDDDGVTFKSVIDGSTHRFTPERSIEIQQAIGADIIFAFDECLSPTESFERQKKAIERTAVWAKRCLDFFRNSNKDGQASSQALFGIWKFIR